MTMLPMHKFINQYSADICTMNDEEAQTFLSCCMAETSLEQEKVDELFKELFDRYGKITYNPNKIEFSKPLLQVLLTIGKVPGTIRLYVHSLCAYAKEQEKKKLTMDDFAAVYPMGVPTEEKLSEIWASQKQRVKGKPENAIDDISFW